jgi:cobalt-zinc-cadmium efflux system outer membrane protein
MVRFAVAAAAFGATLGATVYTASAAAQSPAAQAAATPALASLVAEALQNNPELRGAAKEAEAAGQRVRPAGALDDPMLEAGVLNAPIQPLRLNREDMTMKMLGLSQKLPFPGKRALREQVAAKDAETLGYGVRETTNRVARDVKLAYFDLALTEETIKQLQSNRQILEQFLRIAEGRYAVGQATQAEVLKAQTQLSRMSE